MMEKWVYDVEVFPNFFCITFQNVETKEIKIFSIYDKINQISELEDFVNREIVLIGYNNISYDNIILQYLLENKDSSNILKELFKFSSELVSTKRNFVSPQFKKYQNVENVKYQQIDLMRIIEVNGNVPSLKLVGIILHWNKVQDLPFKYDHIVKNMEEYETIIKYNKNDVGITLKLYEKLLPQIELREKLSILYETDMRSCSDSKIGDKILEKYYVEKTGIKNVYSLIDKVIEHDQFPLKDCIHSDINFRTNFLRRIKRELEETLVRKTDNYQVKKLITFGGVDYQFASGGLHSVDFPALYKTDENHIIRDVDFSSFYPSMMIKNHIVPEHIGEVFIDIVEQITKERIAAKKTDKVKAAGLKISANALYGKLGFAGSWFRDNRAVLKVTISGQLYLLMLIERFVLAGIEVISANTDGIVCRIKRDMEDIYYDIANNFSKEIGIGIEFTDYDIYARRDVNNYISRKYDGEIKYKGCFTPEPEIKKGYKYPIIPNAVYKYILEDTPIKDTIYNHKEILDFCISQKMDSKFEAEFHFPDGEVQKLQKTNRFFVSNKGGKLIKRNKETDKIFGLFVNQNLTILNNYNEIIPIEYYDVNYDFYVDEANKLIEDIKFSESSFEPFMDEAEDFTPPKDIKRREEFFYRFHKIKSLPEKFLDNLLWLKDNYTNNDFLDFLVFAEENSKLSSNFTKMIKINYFIDFGNNKKLDIFYQEFTKGKSRYSKGLTENTKQKRISELREIFNNLENSRYKISEQLTFEFEILGYINATYPIDKRYIYVSSVDTKFSPRIEAYCLATGKTDSLKIQKRTFESNKIKAGDIIYASKFTKKPNVKFIDGKYVDDETIHQWWLDFYKIVSHEEFDTIIS